MWIVISYYAKFMQISRIIFPSCKALEKTYPYLIAQFLSRSFAHIFNPAHIFLRRMRRHIRALLTRALVCATPSGVGLTRNEALGDNTGQVPLAHMGQLAHTGQVSLAQDGEQVAWELPEQVWAWERRACRPTAAAV